MNTSSRIQKTSLVLVPLLLVVFAASIAYAMNVYPTLYEHRWDYWYGQGSDDMTDTKIEHWYCSNLSPGDRTKTYVLQENVGTGPNAMGFSTIINNSYLDWRTPSSGSYGSASDWTFYYSPGSVTTEIIAHLNKTVNPGTLMDVWNNFDWLSSSGTYSWSQVDGYMWYDAGFYNPYTNSYVPRYGFDEIRLTTGDL